MKSTTAAMETACAGRSGDICTNFSLKAMESQGYLYKRVPVEAAISGWESLSRQRRRAENSSLYKEKLYIKSSEGF